jgi:hypothetical protein
MSKTATAQAGLERLDDVAHLPSPTTELDAVRVVDDIFLQMAEAGARSDLPLDDAVEAMWLALESGALRLVVAGKRLRVVEVAGPPEARRLLAEAQWPLVAARRRVLCGLYEAQPQDVRRPLIAPPD